MAHNAHISQDFISLVIAGEAFADFSLLAFRNNTDLSFLYILYCPLAIWLSTRYIVLALFMSTRYKFLAPLFLFPRVAFSRGTNVPYQITGAEFAIPWALAILFSVLVFQDAFHDWENTSNFDPTRVSVNSPRWVNYQEFSHGSPLEILFERREN